MNREEFTEKFKVGDKIRDNEWSSCFYLDVKYIGIDNVIGVDENRLECVFLISDHSWEFYKEPVEKDLSDVFNIYQVNKQEDLLSVTMFRGNKAELEFQVNRAKDSKGLEYLTEEQAVERGLKI